MWASRHNFRATLKKIPEAHESIAACEGLDVPWTQVTTGNQYRRAIAVLGTGNEAREESRKPEYRRRRLIRMKGKGKRNELCRMLFMRAQLKMQ